jgi:hypothetical protein
MHIGDKRTSTLFARSYLITGIYSVGTVPRVACSMQVPDTVKETKNVSFIRYAMENVTSLEGEFLNNSCFSTK